MAIIGFRQDPGKPPGAGFFKGSDGKEKYAYAPEVAAQFAGVSPTAGLLPPTQGAPDMRLAFGDGQMMPGGPPPSRLDAGGGLGAGAPPPIGPPAAATPPLPPPPPARVVPPAAAPPPPPAPPAVGQPNPVLAAQQDGVGDIMRAVASAPAGPRKAAGYQDKSRSVTVEAGAPYSEAQADDRALAEANVQQAHLSATRAFADEQEMRASALSLQKEHINTELQAAQGKQAAKQQMYQDERSRIQGLMDATANQKIDTGAWFKENEFGGVMAIIGQAMQNFASIKTGHGPTNAMLDKIVDRSVAAQRSDIEQGRVRTGNALHMLNLQMGDLDQSTEALKMVQKKAIDAEIARQGAMHSSQDAKSKTQEWLAQRNQEFTKNEQTLYNLSVGKTTVKTDQAYQAASGGGMQDPLARIKRMGEGADALRKMGVPEDQIAKSLGLPTEGGKAGKDVKTEAEKFGKEVESSKANEVLSSLTPVENMLNKYAGQETIPGIKSENIATRGYRGVVDTVSGQGTAEKHLYSDEERNNRQTFEFMKADIRHAITGAGMSDTERKNLDDMVEKARTASDLRNAVGVLKQRATSRIDSIAQGYSPEAVQLYHSRGAPKAPAPERKVGP